MPRPPKMAVAYHKDPSQGRVPKQRSEHLFLENFHDGFAEVDTPGLGIWCLLFAVREHMAVRYGSRAPSLVSLYREHMRVIQKSPVLAVDYQAGIFTPGVVAEVVQRIGRRYDEELRLGMVNFQADSEQWAHVYLVPDVEFHDVLWVRNTADDKRGYFYAIFPAPEKPNSKSLRRLRRDAQLNMLQFDPQHVINLEKELLKRDRWVASTPLATLEQILSSDKPVSEEVQERFGDPHLNNPLILAEEFHTAIMAGSRETTKLKDTDGDLVETPIWQGPSNEQILFIPKSFHRSRFRAFHIRAGMVAVPKTICRVHEAARVNMPDAMVHYRYALARASLPATPNESVQRYMIDLLDTINWKVHLSSQPIWARFRGTMNPLLAVVLWAAELSVGGRATLRTAVAKTDEIDHRIFQPGLELKLDNDGQLWGWFKDGERAVLGVRNGWEPDHHMHRMRTDRSRLVEDKAFRKLCLYVEDDEVGDEGKGISTATTSQGIRWDSYLGDQFLFEPSWHTYLAGRAPDCRLIRSSSQRKFARRHGNSMLHDVEEETGHPIGRDTRCDPGFTRRSTTSNRRELSTPGRTHVVMNLIDAVCQMIDFVGTRTNRRPLRDVVEQEIDRLANAIDSMPASDPPGTPEETRTSFKSYFVAQGNQRRANDLVRDYLPSVLERVFPEETRRLPQTLSRIYMTAEVVLRQCVDLIQDEHDPVPQPTK